MMRGSPRRITPASHHQPHPAGATLTEVLMALLIMSIGVVAVISLFPLSLVSSIRASQLTTAKIFKDNVQEMVHIAPEMLAPPFDATIWNIPPGLNLAGAGTYWQPLTEYSVGEVVLPTLKKGKVFPVPYFALVRLADGRSGPIEPDWNHSTTKYDEDGDDIADWQVIRIPNFVIDPLGYQFTTAGTRQVFGNRDGFTDVPNLPRLLSRRSPIPGLGAEAAQRFCSSPDSWSVLWENVPLAFENSNYNVRFSNSVDVTGIDININYPTTRIVFTTPDQQNSVIRYPTTGSSGNVLVLNAPVDGRYTGPARLEIYEPRFSFLLAVSNPLYHSGVDSVQFKEMFSPPKLSIAVFFNRQFSSNIEHAYKANFGNYQYTDDTSVNNSNLQTDQIQLSWQQGSEPEPYLKVGSYILDARKLIFYRIINVTKGSGIATVTVDTPIEARARTYNEGADQPGLAICMPGIVHVYNATDID